MDVFEKDGKGNISGLSAELVLEFESEEMAKNVLRSIGVDNLSFISCHRESRRIVCRATAHSPGSLLHTLDDFLACVITAENVYKSV